MDIATVTKTATVTVKTRVLPSSNDHEQIADIAAALLVYGIVTIAKGVLRCDVLMQGTPYLL